MRTAERCESSKTSREPVPSPSRATARREARAIPRKSAMKIINYLNLYFSFISTEIPNFIQIFSLMTIFSSLLFNTTHRLILVIVISILLTYYLLGKSFIFLVDQITSQFSESNLLKLDDQKLRLIFSTGIVVTVILFSGLSYKLSFLIESIFSI